MTSFTAPHFEIVREVHVAKTKTKENTIYCVCDDCLEKKKFIYVRSWDCDNYAELIQANKYCESCKRVLLKFYPSVKLAN